MNNTTYNITYDSFPSVKRKRSITTVVLAFIICVYPLIYQLYPDGGAGTINKVLLFLFIIIFACTNASFYRFFFSSTTNTLLSLSMLYILVSITIYSSNLTSGDFFRELLYTLAPVLIYFIVETFDSKEQNRYIKIVVLCLCFVILIGVLDIFGFNFSSAWANALDKKGKANFISYYSPITMGYVAQLLFALTLYRMTGVRFITKHRTIFILIFLTISILTLQRAAYLGLFVSSLTYFCDSLAKIARRRTFILRTRTIIAWIIVVFALILIAIFVNWSNVDNAIDNRLGFDLVSYVKAELDSFSLSSVQHDRRNQAIIFNDHNLFNMLFGEGYGKYSPNNMNSICRMPDASYIRLYNELGIVGSVLFFLPYFLMLIDSIVKKKAFAVYFVFFTFAAFYFNRVLWAIPISYIIYPMLSICRRHPCPGQDN